MSEQKAKYMTQLDEWVDSVIFTPLSHAYMSGKEEGVVDAQDFVRLAIRTKVLESYRNGQAAGPRKVFKRS